MLSTKIADPSAISRSEIAQNFANAKFCKKCKNRLRRFRKFATRIFGKSVIFHFDTGRKPISPEIGLAKTGLPAVPK